MIRYPGQPIASPMSVSLNDGSRVQLVHARCAVRGQLAARPPGYQLSTASAKNDIAATSVMEVQRASPLRRPSYSGHKGGCSGSLNFRCASSRSTCLCIERMDSSGIPKFDEVHFARILREGPLPTASRNHPVFMAASKSHRLILRGGHQTEH